MGQRCNGLSRLINNRWAYFRQRRRSKELPSEKLKNPKSLSLSLYLARGKAPIMAWMRLIQSARSVLTTAPASSTLNFHRFYSKSAAPYHGKPFLFVQILRRRNADAKLACIGWFVTLGLLQVSFVWRFMIGLLVWVDSVSVIVIVIQSLQVFRED